MMKKIILSLRWLLVACFGGYAQSGSTGKTKPATAQKPAADTTPALNLPPLPAIDTTAAPDDELTREVKKLLAKTGTLTAVLQNMAAMLDIQRRTPGQQLPVEFFDRFTNEVQNGRVERLLTNLIIKVYRQKFTADDIKEVNKFYDSPVGKKLAAETVNISTAAR